MAEKKPLESYGEDALKKAVSLKCANCYAAMSFANAIGGSASPAWEICHTHTLKDILAEVTKRGLSLDVKASVDEIPVTDSLYYKRATGAMTDAEFQAAFRKWQRGENENANQGS